MSAAPLPVRLLRPGADVPLGRWLWRGAVAGAAGTTALNAVTYLDMAARGRPSSSTPEETVAKVGEKSHVPIPGDEETRENRLSGLGPLMGLATGTGAGVALGALYAAGARPPLALGSLATALGVMVATNAPMTLLSITDPRSWPVSSWLTDAVPHAAYGVVTVWTLRELASRRP